MRLHEYETKALLARHGLPVPRHLVASTPAEAREAAERLGTRRFVVKAQVRAAGRGMAGGIKLVDTPREAEDYAESILGTRLVTRHTSAEGLEVERVLVEEQCDVARELYVGLSIDEHGTGIRVTAFADGGMDLERVEREMPERIIRSSFDASSVDAPAQCRVIASAIGLRGDRVERFTSILISLARCLVEEHLECMEIDPLVITGRGDFVCLDAQLSDRRG